MIPATIATAVAPETIAKVTRLFNNTAFDVICELLQNARRAGARGDGLPHRRTHRGDPARHADALGVSDGRRAPARGDARPAGEAGDDRREHAPVPALPV